MSVSCIRCGAGLLLVGILVGCGADQSSGGADHAISQSDSTVTQTDMGSDSSASGGTLTQPGSELDAQTASGGASDSANQQFWGAMDSTISENTDDSSVIETGVSATNTAVVMAPSDFSTTEEDLNQHTADETSIGRDDTGSDVSHWSDLVDLLEGSVRNDAMQSEDRESAAQRDFVGDKQELIAEKLAALNLIGTIETGVSVKRQTSPEYADRSYAVQPEIEPADGVIRYLNQ